MSAKLFITPRGVKKEIREIIDGVYRGPDVTEPADRSAETDYAVMNEHEVASRIKALESEMMTHARNLDFEKAAKLRDEIRRLRESAFGASAAS